MTLQTKTLTLASTTGGVGKTTVAANLSGLVADFGMRVLMIDADPQATLSTYYPMRTAAVGGLQELLLDHDISSTISESAIAGLDVVQSNDQRDFIASHLRALPDGLFQLRYAVDQRRSSHRYALIVIDTQGAAGLLQSNGVLAADLILCPVLLEMLSARDFVRSTQQLLRELEGFAAMLAIALPKLFAVANRVDRTHDGAAINKALREVFSDQASVQFLNVAIPSLVAYREATTRQIPVHIHETHRRGNSPAAHEVMVELLGEIIDLQGLTLNLDLAAGFGSDAPAHEAARGR